MSHRSSRYFVWMYTLSAGIFDVTMHFSLFDASSSLKRLKLLRKNIISIYERIVIINTYRHNIFIYKRCYLFSLFYRALSRRNQQNRFSFNFFLVTLPYGLPAIFQLPYILNRAVRYNPYHKRPSYLHPSCQRFHSYSRQSRSSYHPNIQHNWDGRYVPRTNNLAKNIPNNFADKTHSKFHQ